MDDGFNTSQIAPNQRNPGNSHLRIITIVFPSQTTPQSTPFQALLTFIARG